MVLAAVECRVCGSVVQDDAMAASDGDSLDALTVDESLNATKCMYQLRTLPHLNNH